MPSDLDSVSNQPEKVFDATVNSDAIESALKAVQKLHEAVSFTPAPIPEDVLVMAALKKIPLLTGLLGDADATTSAIGELVKVTNKAGSAMDAAAKGLHFVGLALDIVNFVRIPCIYLASYILGIKPPITLSNNAKWLYSAVLLTATIVSLTVSPAAPFIAIGAASLALGVAAFTLGKMIYQRHQHQKAIHELTAEIEKEEKSLLEMQNSALALESSLKKAIAEHNDNLAGLLTGDIISLASQFEAQKQKLQALHDKRFVHQENLKNKDTGKIVDKAVGVGLAAVVVIGLVVSLFFPPIGYAILVGAGVTGLTYAIGRLMTPLFVKVGNWIYTRFRNKAESPESQDKNTPDLDNKPAQEKTNVSVSGNGLAIEQAHFAGETSSSTAITAMMLSGKEAVTSLRVAQLQSSRVLNDELHDQELDGKPAMAESHSHSHLSLVDEVQEDEGETERDGDTESEGGKHKIR